MTAGVPSKGAVYKKNIHLTTWVVKRTILEDWKRAWKSKLAYVDQECGERAEARRWRDCRRTGKERSSVVCTAEPSEHFASTKHGFQSSGFCEHHICCRTALVGSRCNQKETRRSNRVPKGVATSPALCGGGSLDWPFIALRSSRLCGFPAPASPKLPQLPKPQAEAFVASTRL